MLVELAVTRAGYNNALAARLTGDALLQNWKIADGYGCFDADGLSEMRQGKAPTIQRGTTYQGDQLSVDHIVPRAVCPELGNVIANLELMPLRISAFRFQVSAFAPPEGRAGQSADVMAPMK